MKHQTLNFLISVCYLWWPVT